MTLVSVVLSSDAYRHSEGTQREPSARTAGDFGQSLASPHVLHPRVTQLREQQLVRQDCLNSALEGDQLISVCRLAPKTQTWFVAAIKALSLSARSAHRRLRVARTLADLGGHDAVSISHVETALSFREIDSQSAAKRA